MFLNFLKKKYSIFSIFLRFGVSRTPHRFVNLGVRVFSAAAVECGREFMVSEERKRRVDIPITTGFSFFTFHTSFAIREKCMGRFKRRTGERGSGVTGCFD